MGKAFNMNIISYVDHVRNSDEHPILFSKNHKTYYSLDHIQKLNKAIEYAKSFENCRINSKGKILTGFNERLPKVNCIIYINENIESLLTGSAFAGSRPTERKMERKEISPEEHYFIRFNDLGNILQLETVTERTKRIEKEILAKFISQSDHLTKRVEYFGSRSAKPLALDVPDVKYENDCIY